MKQISEWRREIIAGTLIGPRLAAVAGPMIAGPGAPFVKDTVATEEEARRAVIARKEMGVDFIKVHEGLSRSPYFAIADESKRQRLTLVGHRGPVTASEALEAGHHCLEHAGFLLAATSSIEAEVISQGLGMMSPAEMQLLARARQSYSEDRLKALCSHFRSKRAWLVPTLVTGYTWDYSKDGSMPSPDWLKYMPQRVTRVWKAPNPMMAQLTEKDFAEAQANFDKSIEIVGSMHRAGVNIMAGTDAGVLLRGLIPGISLHSEIALFVKAGFTPLEALRAATLAPARFLKMESTTGSIERGKAADLVLLEANPLEDIRHTEKIAAVIVGGRLHDRRALDAMLTTLADGARK
jgi:imidazolonepropionase-like amidohydrolase